MFKQVTTIVLISTAGLLTALANGCSSSSSPNTSNDAGGGGNSGDSGAVTQPSGDSGGGTEKDSGGGTVGDGGVVTPEDSGGGGGGDSATTPPCFTAPTTYTAGTASPTPVVSANQCAPADITGDGGFVSSCGANGTNAACNAWLGTNVAAFSAADAAVSTTCGACMFPADSTGNFTNAGPIFNVTLPGNVDSFGPNVGACVQLLDTTNGAACALALDNTNTCDTIACGQVQTCTATQGQACQTDVNAAGGACATPAATQSACQSDAADGGAYTTCTASQDYDTILTYVIDQMCGAGAP